MPRNFHFFRSRSTSSSLFSRKFEHLSRGKPSPERFIKKRDSSPYQRTREYRPKQCLPSVECDISMKFVISSPHGETVSTNLISYCNGYFMIS